MLAGFVVLMILLCGVESKVKLTVLPDVIDPGLTSQFTLNCGVGELKTGRIKSFSISRRTVAAREDNVSAKEFIVEMRGPPLNHTTNVATGYENLQLNGLIYYSRDEVSEIIKAGYERNPNMTSEELNREFLYLEHASIYSEGRSFLEVTWPETKVQDLGVYTCDVIIQNAGTEETWSAKAKVSISKDYLVQLVVKVMRIQENQEVFNQTLTEAQSDIGSIRTDLDGLLKTANESCIKTPSKRGNDTQVTYGFNETITEGVVIEDPVPHLLRLTSALENLEANFHRFTEILKRVDTIIATLEEKVDEDPANKTSDIHAVDDWQVNKTSGDQGAYSNVSYVFKYEGNHYTLYNRVGNITLHEAQVKCESQSSYLAEIPTITDFSYITEQIDSHVGTGELVFVGGQNTRDQDDWTFRYSNHSIEFFNLNLFDGDDTSDGDECLALRKSVNGWNTVFVACYKIKHDALFLCSRASESADF